MNQDEIKLVEGKFGTVFVTRASILDHQMYTMNIANVTMEELRNFYENPRGLVQDVFPHLSNTEREFLISGITPEIWNKTFKEE